MPFTKLFARSTVEGQIEKKIIEEIQNAIH